MASATGPGLSQSYEYDGNGRRAIVRFASGVQLVQVSRVRHQKPDFLSLAPWTVM
ncbi:hypothetical protein [Ideonella sp.]|uniref:hypothetical protein n=1 Tax=Ideonella sp. TaxID=1929293 RepID=UPI003BB5E686